MLTERLTELLSQRLNAIVPSGFHVSAEGDRLIYSCDGDAVRSGSDVAGNLGNGSSLEQCVAWCAQEILGQLQDYVDEKSTEPWPGERSVPRAHAAVVDGALRMWFGDESSPLLECGAIDLRELEAPSHDFLVDPDPRAE